MTTLIPVAGPLGALSVPAAQTGHLSNKVGGFFRGIGERVLGGLDQIVNNGVQAGVDLFNRRVLPVGADLQNAIANGSFTDGGQPAQTAAPVASQSNAATLAIVAGGALVVGALIFRTRK